MPDARSGQMTATPALLTQATEFLACPSSGKGLLAVQAGIAAEDAATRASSCLAAAVEILEMEDCLSDASHGAILLIRTAKALINALRLDVEED